MKRLNYEKRGGGKGKWPIKYGRSFRRYLKKLARSGDWDGGVIVQIRRWVLK